MRRQLRFSPKPHAVCLGPRASFTRPCADQLTLELRKTSQYRQHQPSVRGGSVGPGIIQRPKARTLPPDLVQHIQEIAGRAGQAVEARNEQDVTALETGDRFPELRTIGTG